MCHIAGIEERAFYKLIYTLTLTLWTICSSLVPNNIQLEERKIIRNVVASNIIAGAIREK